MPTQTMNSSAPIAIESRALVPGPAAIAAGVIVLAAWYLDAAISWRQAALFLVGAGAGVVLYHAAFGFTSSWRVFISDRRGAGLRAQMLMLAITCAVFFPLIAAGTLWGQPVRGSVSPVGIGVAAGAFIFGLGMQLGGGCASGTLFSVGGTRVVKQPAVPLLFSDARDQGDAAKHGQAHRQPDPGTPQGDHRGRGK